LLSLVVLAWEILGIDTGPHIPHLTISALTQSFRPLNASMLLVWILVGIGYGLARARAPVPARAMIRGPENPGGLVGYLAVSRSAHTFVFTPALLLPASRPAGIVFWLGVVAVGVVLDLVARGTAGRLANAEELVRFITAPMVANIFLVAAWTYAGYHLFAH
jgi:hypothetical protein